MEQYLDLASAIFNLIVLIVIFIVLRHVMKQSPNHFEGSFTSIEKAQEKLERAVWEDMGQIRKENGDSNKQSREELSNILQNLNYVIMTTLGEMATQNKNQFEQYSKEVNQNLSTLNQNILASMGELSTLQKNQFSSFSTELKNSTATYHQTLLLTIGEMSTQQKNMFDNFSSDTKTTMGTHNQSIITTIGELGNNQKNSLDTFSKHLAELTTMNERKLNEIRTTVEEKLKFLQEDNNKKLEQMRLTVDEKLHATLEQRLGDSFKQVSERLEQVHKGLGDMQNLATGVGDLKKVLTNVKARGILGEIQLANLLEQILSPDKYEANVATSKGASERVEFAIKLPSNDKNNDNVYLPIDSKFPLEAYQRLLDAQELGDLQMANEAAKQLENAIKFEAKRIREKYISPPQTTDFAVMFLPIEGLYAEVLRRRGLWETLQRDHKVVITGPSTLAALLNSLQMGFRTLAIQKRSSEVWDLLGAVKSEFGKFGDILEKTQKKLQEASNTIDNAARRGRAIERKLKTVQELPVIEANQVLGELDFVGIE